MLYDSYGLAIEMRGDNSIIRDSRFTNSGGAGAIELDGVTNAIIENNSFENHNRAIRSRALRGNITVRNNEFLANESTSSPSAVEFAFHSFIDSEDAVRIFEDNDIIFDGESSDRVIISNQTPNQNIQDIIRNNTITWRPGSASDVVISSQIGLENSSLLIENNVIETIGTRGGIGILVSPANTLEDNGLFTVQNNVITDTFKGLQIFNADVFTSPGFVFNNSFRTDSPTFTEPMIGIEVPGTFNSASGTVQLQIVNNIMQGREGRNDIGIMLDEDFQLDSDYNLFYRIGTN